LAYMLAFTLRFDPSLPSRYSRLLALSIGFVIAGKLIVFASFGLYQKLWRFIDQQDFEAIVRAVVVASFLMVGIFFLIPASVVPDPPRGVIALDFLLTLAFLVGTRFLVRMVVERPSRAGFAPRDAREVLIVTGAGGSIGSELCRQIARVAPKQLVLVDNAENSLFEIRRELEFDRHFGRVVSILADVKDAVRVREVFAEHRPAVVFHAAAYKHVPLMEENAVEAVRNNAVATRI